MDTNETLRAVIGVRGTDAARMGLARLIHDLHPGASAPSIRQHTIPDLKIGARSLSGMIYVQKEIASYLSINRHYILRILINKKMHLISIIYELSIIYR